MSDEDVIAACEIEMMADRIRDVGQLLIGTDEDEHVVIKVAT